MIININIKEKKAEAEQDYILICGNSDYVINFTFDSEWESHTLKTARFSYVQNGVLKHTDVVFEGAECNVPIFSNICLVKIGVYAGDLRTTTPCTLKCEKSILCETGANEDPPEDIYNQIIKKCNEAVSTVNNLEERANNGEFNGKDGEKGDKGENAVITEVSATVSNTIGTPQVLTSMGGDEQNRSFRFDFSGLKGEKGEKGEQGLKGEAGKDAKSFELIKTIIVGEDGVTTFTFNKDDNGNTFKLDALSCVFKLPNIIDTSNYWRIGGNGSSSDYLLAYFNPDSAGTTIITRSERMCKGFWHSIRNRNSDISIINTPVYASGVAPSIDYVTSVYVYIAGAPVGTQLIICGRRANE